MILLFCFFFFFATREVLLSPLYYRRILPRIQESKKGCRKMKYLEIPAYFILQQPLMYIL